MPQETIFHKIVRKEAPADIVFEDDDCIAFSDIRPKAPLHLLFVPKQFVASIIDVDDTTRELPGMLIRKAQEFAKDRGISGYKLVFHVGREGGQEVDYLHLHFMSGQTLEK